MKWVIRFALVLTSCLAIGGERPKLQMILTGDWHGDEVQTRSGEQWLALVDDQIEPVVVKVERFHDGLVDAAEERTGKRVVVSGADDYTVLLRGVSARTVERSVRSELLRGQSGAKAQLVLSTDALTLETRLLHVSAGEESDAIFEIVISGGGLSQAIGRTTEASIEPIWSGDLDGDGRIDLIIDTSEHYNVFAPMLFLSTEAGEGEIVGAAASFVTTGC